MSMEQCNRCLYRDTIVEEAGQPYCPVAERPAPGDPCQDFEEDDGRWGAGQETGDGRRGTGDGRKA